MSRSSAKFRPLKCFGPKGFRRALACAVVVECDVDCIFCWFIVCSISCVAFVSLLARAAFLLVAHASLQLRGSSAYFLVIPGSSSTLLYYPLDFRVSEHGNLLIRQCSLHSVGVVAEPIVGSLIRRIGKLKVRLALNREMGSVKLEQVVIVNLERSKTSLTVSKKRKYLW